MLLQSVLPKTLGPAHRLVGVEVMGADTTPFRAALGRIVAATDNEDGTVSITTEVDDEHAEWLQTLLSMAEWSGW